MSNKQKELFLTPIVESTPITATGDGHHFPGARLFAIEQVALITTWMADYQQCKDLITGFKTNSTMQGEILKLNEESDGYALKIAELVEETVVDKDKKTLRSQAHPETSTDIRKIIRSHLGKNDNIANLPGEMIVEFNRNNILKDEFNQAEVIEEIKTKTYTPKDN